MKIAVITSGFLPVPPVLGGAVEALTEFYLEENEKLGEHEFTVYSVHAQNADVEAAKFKHCKFKFINTNSLWYRLKKKVFQKTHKCMVYDHHTEFFIHEVMRDLPQQHFDVIIVENKPGFVLHLAKSTDAKIVLHLHNDHLNSTTPYAKEIFERCHKIITVSDYIKKCVATICATEKTANKTSLTAHEQISKIVTVHNGIDLETFYKAKPIDRATLGLSKNDFVLVFSGRLIPEKGIKELLEAMTQLKDEQNIKLLVIGGASFGCEIGDNEFVACLRQMASSLQNRVIFTGYIPSHVLPSYIKTADIAVLPSIWEEPFGLTIVEAMAAGLPVVATNSGGIPEIVNDGCGYLINHNNIQQRIQKTILALYSNRNLRERMGRKALERSASYSKDAYAQRLLTTLF